MQLLYKLYGIEYRLSLLQDLSGPYNPTYLCSGVRIKSEVYVDISQAVLSIRHEVSGMFDGLGHQVSGVERVHYGLFEVLGVGLLSQVRQVHAVEEGLVPEISFVTHFLRGKHFHPLVFRYLLVIFDTK